MTNQPLRCAIHPLVHCRLVPGRRCMLRRRTCGISPASMYSFLAYLIREKCGNSRGTSIPAMHSLSRQRMLDAVAQRCLAHLLHYGACDGACYVGACRRCGQLVCSHGQGLLLVGMQPQMKRMHAVEWLAQIAFTLAHSLGQCIAADVFHREAMPCHRG
jgi:hypothetical protein